MFLDPVPLDPDPDTARQWLVDELAKPAYAEAQPTWFDRAAKAMADFFDGLFTVDAPGGDPTVLMVVIAVVVVVLVILAVLIWGNPRLRRRSEVVTDPLFDDDDERTADELRRMAEAARAGGDHAAAVVLRMRAIARALRERGAVNAGPGATVHAFAAQAITAFPTHAGALTAAANDFDDVRYLRRPGTAAMVDALRDLDVSLAGTRPAALAVLEPAS